ncbi:MAG TPA: DUF721 domain-containing protein [Paludibacteraceae bacterium]|nr:DUF721 domain-containing protein [Paludibacteraceae bacterium]HQB68643.1 DUF721 domain-containing protein [Paludibacteraceae bacterium]HRS67783.1 DUF721 domain-containing protein [Paludibacteraceae bacterium]
MQRKEAVRLSSELVREALSANGSEMVTHLTELSVQEAWIKVLGPLAQYATNLEFKEGTLYVRITSAVLRNDLFMQRSQLIEKINEVLGKKIVYSIVFR